MSAWFKAAEDLLVAVDRTAAAAAGTVGGSSVPDIPSAKGPTKATSSGRGLGATRLGASKVTGSSILTTGSKTLPKGAPASRATKITPPSSNGALPAPAPDSVQDSARSPADRPRGATEASAFPSAPVLGDEAGASSQPIASSPREETSGKTGKTDETSLQVKQVDVPELEDKPSPAEPPQNRLSLDEGGTRPREENGQAVTGLEGEDESGAIEEKGEGREEGEGDDAREGEEEQGEGYEDESASADEGEEAEGDEGGDAAEELTSDDTFKGSDDPAKGSTGLAVPSVGALVQSVGLTSVQKELEEAKELLFGSSTAGQSKEARLSKICAQLQSRLKECKAENEQLEELLTQERESRAAVEESLALAHAQLAEAQQETAAAEESAQGALEAKNLELEEISRKLAEAKRENAELQGKLAALEASAEALVRTRDMSEARVIHALREELTAAELRCDQEQRAHAQTRQEFASREVELEQRVAESTAALMRVQRSVDERSHRALELEEKISLLEAECSALQNELQEAQEQLSAASLHRQQAQHLQQGKQGQGGQHAQGNGKEEAPSPRPKDHFKGAASENVSVSAQIQAWREEAERARQMQRDAEKRVQDAKAEAQQMRVEMESLRRQLDSSGASVGNAELERRFMELTELLCTKQAQLEAMASEKQAAQLQMEKQARELREAKVQAESDRMAMLSLRSSAGMGRGGAGGINEDDLELRSLVLPGSQRRIGKGFQQAAKLLDRGTVTAGRFLWRHPLARMVLVFYLVFVHLFLMHVQHRLQDISEACMSKDRVAQAAEAAAGLVKPAKLLLLR